MRWNELEDQRCAVARAESVLGDRWTMMLVRDCLLGIRRFEDFQSRLGIARRVLTDRLNLLVDKGVLRREAYSQRPLREEYRLTDAGRDLLPVIMALSRWADRHLPHPDGTAVQYRHTDCDEVIEPRVDCPTCASPLTVRNTRAVINQPNLQQEPKK
ncbi:MAG: helix-turn-helix domain-containing protein [Minwuia sp.]|nr:helix-turn-helix domain-containing protein [Minwuia sp.]